MEGTSSAGRWLRAALAAAAVLTLALPSAGFAAGDIPEIHKKPKRDVDTRSASATATAEQHAALERLGARGSFNRFGTVRSLIRPGAELARGVAGENAVAAARHFINDNKELFKVDGSGLALGRDVRLEDSDAHAVILRQHVDDLLVSPEGQVTVALKPGEGGAWDVVYASSSLAGAGSLSGAASLSAGEGLKKAAEAAGLDAGAVVVSEQRAGWTSAVVEGLSGEQLARLVAFPTDTGTFVPAWETYVMDENAGEMTGYWQFVHAGTGEVLLRENAVDYDAENPRWKVFPANPHAGLDEFPWNYPSADNRDLWCWLKEPLCQYLPSTNAGAKGIPWDQQPPAMATTFTTKGNSAHTQENWQLSSPPQPVGHMPVSPTRDYVYPWTNVWFETGCNQANFVPGTGNDINAAVVNLFMGHNRMHDWSYNLGFREDTWNAQEHNFGVNPAGERDPIVGLAQAGAVTGGYPTYSGRDNAYMATRPDGTRSWSGMFLWQPLAGAFYSPCVDGDYDMGIIGHEYGHMIENRMIGKGNRRLGAHAGMMGESHGDLLGMEYVNEYNFAPAGGGDNNVADATTTVVGPYATGNDKHGIRNYDMAFSFGEEYPQPGRYPTANPLNFSDIGYDITGPQVHADGEIWSATQFDIRELLLNRYPGLGQDAQRECADGLRPPQACPGNRRWVQLLFDAFLLMPVRPTFLDARNAMLAADVIRFGGANQDLLWLAYARRGFGQNAFNSSSEDFEPVPDFESPLHEEGTVVFNAFALNEGNAPIANANFYVGHYEARVSPIADTNPATTGQNRDNVARFVPDDGPHTGAKYRAYDFMVTAQGYGAVRFRLTELKPGETRVVNIYMPTNWASHYKGAVATGDGVRHNDLIDDTEATNWESVGPPAPGRQVLIQLAGGERRINQVKVGTLLRPGQNRFTALREFEVYACSARANGDVEVGGVKYACQRVVKSQADAFPGDAPRPVAPAMILRTWESGNSAATHALFRVIHNQCTGNDAYHGEQDTDPLNTSTDCRIGTLPVLPPRHNAVRTSEVQIFSDRPRADGAQVIE